jgi:hypothetical protein
VPSGDIRKNNIFLDRQLKAEEVTTHSFSFDRHVYVIKDSPFLEINAMLRVPNGKVLSSQNINPLKLSQGS